MATTTSSYPRKSTGTVFRSSSPSPRFHHRSSSPKRLNLYGHSSCSQSVSFSLDRPISSGNSVSLAVSGQKRKCLCSPTTHPGSFRCALHRRSSSESDYHSKTLTTTNRSCWTSNDLSLRRSAMVNSLVKIGAIEGEPAKRSLTTLIRQSSLHFRLRADFQPRPSRLSLVSRDQDS